MLPPTELFEILKDDVVKVLHSMCEQIWKAQQWSQDWKRSDFIPMPGEGNAKECTNYHMIVLISPASKLTLKILQARLQKHGKILRRGGKNAQENCTKKIFMTQIIMMV